MAGLSTISPNRRGVVDGKRPSGEGSGIGSNREEARVKPDPGVSGRVGQWQAGSSERRLRDGVVLDVESEPDGVTGRSADTTRSESEVSVGTTDDDIDDVSVGGSRGGSRRVRVRRVGRRPHIGAEGNCISNE